MFLKNLFKVNKVLALLVTSTMLLAPTYAIMMETYVPNMNFQRGMCFATWDKSQYASQYSDKALEKLAEMSVDHVQIIVTWYQEKVDSLDIEPSGLTPSDSSINHAIKTAHKLGLKVMLKPHIDLLDDQGSGYWRADIGFYKEEDWNDWFNSYEKFIMHYAKIAKKNKVALYCVGTELSFASQKTDKWKELIKNVRSSFDGKITYAANWDNYKNIKFWDDLDFAGIDAYFPLSYKSNPTLEDLKKGWLNWAVEIEGFFNETKKPILFTEIGYPSGSNAPSEPWKTPSNGNADVEIQAKCYKAFFETVCEKPWLAGVYWWQWAPTIYGGGKNNRLFTPLNKPAANILAEKYANIKRLSESTISKDIEGLLANKQAIMTKKENNRKQTGHPIKADNEIKTINAG
ncbi:MAG: hypothetical protein HQL29_05995 [Candidatus Omnitrophica bacterium]|nr:hypothetical protein [Candidatus Omnitrophota bacterium]